MRRFIILLVASLSGVLLLAGMALADVIQCPTGPGNLCVGSPRSDVITGTDGLDNVLARGGDDRVDAKQGDDVVRGGPGNDILFGDDPTIGANNPRTLSDGNDTVFGEAGNDSLFGYGGSDTLRGGVGNDRINAQELSLNLGTDAVFGEAGNDTISARDGRFDSINCGAGLDTVSFDPGLDRIIACEILNPPGGAAAVQAPGTAR